jgi:hypothetical protein
MRPFFSVNVPPAIGLSSGPSSVPTARPCRAPQIRDEALKHREVRIAVGAHVDGPIVQVGDAGDVNLRILTDDAHVHDADGVAIERQANRSGIAQRVVEQAHVEAVDRGVHEQIVDITQIADHTYRSADDGGGERRELRQEQTDVRIE